MRYRVTLEPTNRPYIFHARNRGGAAGARTCTCRTTVSSRPDDITSRAELRRGVAPATRNAGPLDSRTPPRNAAQRGSQSARARARDRDALARRADDAEYARAVLQWFQRRGLEYTLEPGTTTLDSVDTTLFDTKLGFCAPFRVRLRHDDARGRRAGAIVTGLSRRRVESGRRLSTRAPVRSACVDGDLARRPGLDAFDPTAVVAPSACGGAYTTCSADSLPAAQRAVPHARGSPASSQIWDGANQWWQESVVEFNLRAQLDVLRRLGIDSPDWRHSGWAFAAGLLAVDLWIAAPCGAASRARSRTGSAARGCGRRANSRASRRRARPAEGPIDYATRIAAARPDLAPRSRRSPRATAHCGSGRTPRTKTSRRWSARCESFGLTRTGSGPIPGTSSTGTRSSRNPPTTNNRTSEMIDARSLCASAATIAMSSGPSTVANLPIML